MNTRILLISTLALAALAPAIDARQGQMGPGPGGPPPGQFPGGPGMGRERQIVGQFDTNGDGRLNTTERKAAREFLATQPAAGRGMGRGGPGGPGGRGGAMASPVEPGARLTPKDVKTYGREPLYDMGTLRTLFLQFEAEDWEAELTAFNNTDVDVPATLVVDGKTYREVGVHYRGASSFFTVPAGRKRSLNLAIDFAVPNQRLGGYSTLNLLNSHTDPTFLRTVLYLEAARNYTPAPKANYTRVVINGESWGVYVSQQQFNKELINEWFKTDAGARWKVPGSPGGRGGLEYLGEDAGPYRNLYEIKSKDDPQVMGGPYPADTHSEPDAAGPARAGARTSVGRGRRAEVSRARGDAREFRWVLGAGERLRHLSGSEGTLPFAPARRERDVLQRPRRRTARRDAAASRRDRRGARRGTVAAGARRPRRPAPRRTRPSRPGTRPAHWSE